MIQHEQCKTVNGSQSNSPADTGRTTSRERSGRSADFQSAVSPNCIRRGVGRAL